MPPPSLRDARAPWGLRQGADELLFGTLGGLRPEKNLGRLLRIAAMLPKDLRWRLVIAGEGQERAALEAQAHALGLSERVVWTGFVERPGSLLGELDVYVLTSDTEQMPISVLEAMAVGLPVLATDVGDLRLMLPAQSRSTCLFAREEENAFAERLAALLASPDERRRLGARTARKRRSSAWKRWSPATTGCCASLPARDDAQARDGGEHPLAAGCPGRAPHCRRHEGDAWDAVRSGIC